MYAGKKVEEADVGALFAEPLHPYTHGLLASVPHLDVMKDKDAEPVERLAEIPGIVPLLIDLPPGCTFAPRCPFADEKCTAEYPPYTEGKPDHWVACWHSDKLYGGGNG
jgi:peptide/nickel transport system ATP-binding protein